MYGSGGFADGIERSAVGACSVQREGRIVGRCLDVGRARYQGLEVRAGSSHDSPVLVAQWPLVDGDSD